jgi:hypothetical protein
LRILITGSRQYKNPVAVKQYLDSLTSQDEIIVGDAHGVDRWVYDYNRIYGKFTLRLFEAAWDLHGNRAGIMRNLEMLDTLPQSIVAFWDGSSRGTKHVIDIALNRRIDVYVIFDW